MIAAAARRVAALSTSIDGEGDIRAVELLRMAAGPLVILHLAPFLALALDGVAYSDRFTEPYLSVYPAVGPALYFAILWVGVAAAAFLSLGFATRVAAATTAAVVGYNLLLSRTHFSNNRFFLLVLLVGLALLPVGRRWSIDAARRRRRGLPAADSRTGLWPLLLMRFEVATVYLASGTSKLIDADWWGGTVTRLRVVQWQDAVADGGVPGWLLDIAKSPEFHSWFAKAAVLTELAIGLGLVLRRTRLGAVWLAVPFHVSIELAASVQVFSYAALAALVIWVTPEAGDRTVVIRGSTPVARLVSRSVRRLDWTGRFALTTPAGKGPLVSLVDRNGVETHGAAAVRRIASRLPLTFWVAAPLNLPPARALWDRVTARVFGPASGRPTADAAAPEPPAR